MNSTPLSISILTLQKLMSCCLPLMRSRDGRQKLQPPSSKPNASRKRIDPPNEDRLYDWPRIGFRGDDRQTRHQRDECRPRQFLSRDHRLPSDRYQTPEEDSQKPPKATRDSDGPSGSQ